MNKYRPAAVALAACAASLSLAACSAGITTASTATTAATSSSSAVSSSRTATSAASSAPAGRMISVVGKVSSFPVPAGAKVAENVSISNTISIGFGKVTLAKVQSFYTQALPKAGYTITGNSASSESGGVMVIQFTGHGYQGQISTLANNPDKKDTLPGLGSKNVTSILLRLK
jgi:ABC-type phosphate transport system substrate-binding protein